MLEGFKLRRKIPCYSLFLASNSLFAGGISLVPAHRELVPNTLKSLHECTPAGPEGTKFSKFP